MSCPAVQPWFIALVAERAAAASLLLPAAEMLEKFGVACAHRLPGEALEGDPHAVIVASADGALPAALAARTAAPVIRVPMADDSTQGVVLLTCPGGGFATVAIGEAGGRNAALLVVSILALTDERLRAAWTAFRQEQTDAVLRQPPPWKPS